MKGYDAVAAHTDARLLPEPPVAPGVVRVLSLVLLLGIVVWFARAGAHRIAVQHPDFEYFYKAGAWMLAHGGFDPGYDLVDGRVRERGTLDWYWPFVPRFMTLFALMPFQTAGCLWLVLNLIAMLVTIRLVGRHLSGLPPQDWPVTQLVPFLLLAAYWKWEFRLNQINNLTLLLLVGSFVCWQRGRNVLSGFWLGLAVLFKLTPGLLVLWFALKRQYRTVAAAVLTVALAGPVADLVALGPSLTADSYRTWVRNAVTGGSQRGLILTQREMDWRNQSLAAVCSRWLHPTNYSTHFDNDPRIRTRYAGDQPRTFNVVTLPLPMVAHLVTAIAGLTLLGLIWLARRPAGELTLWQLRFEWALFLLAMLWLMPVMRRYHMIWALPAISLLGAGVHYAGFRGRWSVLALVCCGLTLAAQFTLLVRPLEAAGSILGSVAVLGLPLVVMLLRLGRNPAALPSPFHAAPHPARARAPDGAGVPAVEPAATNV